jgi:hypothetical protein
VPDDQRPEDRHGDRPDPGPPRRPTGRHLRTDDDGQTRGHYLISARKIRPEDRDVSGPVLGGPHAGYRNILSSDDDPDVPLGATVAFDAWLTDDEAAAFAAASNVVAVDPDVDVPPAVEVIPPPSTLSWMGASLAQQGSFTGAGVKVGVLDGGTTAAVRAQCPWTVAAAAIFVAGQPPVNGDHGCLVSPEAVPPAGQLVEGMIANPDGSGPYSAMSAGLVWACDQGAKVVNISFGSIGAQYAPPQAFRDACAYARNLGVQVTISAGNDGQNGIAWPAALTREYPNVHAIGAVDPANNQIATFSNRDADLSGVTPGVNQLSLKPDGTTRTWQGTSSAAPKAALLIAMASTGGTYTPQQAADALRSTARDLGLGVAVQGRGAWHLANALTQLAIAPPTNGRLMRVYANSLQTIPPSVYTRCKFHATEVSDTSRFTINANRDVITSVTAGLIEIKFAFRWVGHTDVSGDKFAAIGPNIPWDQAGGRLWASWSERGSLSALGDTISCELRVSAGQQFCAWMWQNWTYGWGVDSQVAHPDNRITNLTAEWISA